MEERNKKQRENRASNGNAATKKYEKTHKGYAVRMYRNMLSRVQGVQKKMSSCLRGERNNE